MRERLLGDPGFPVKLSIEVGIGVTMKLLAEISKRGDNFSSELDLVFANVVMAIIADTMLVWLPAPRAATSSQKAPINQTAIGKWLKSCPDNAFQVSHHFPRCCEALYATYCRWLLAVTSLCTDILLLHMQCPAASAPFALLVSCCQHFEGRTSVM